MLMLGQGLYGSAEPAVAGDELDITKPEESSSTTSQNAGAVSAPDSVLLDVADSTPNASGVSTGLAQKVVFFVVIVGVIVAYVRARNGNERSTGQYPV